VLVPDKLLQPRLMFASKPGESCKE